VQLFDFRPTLIIPAHGSVKILHQRTDIHGLSFCSTVVKRDVLKSAGQGLFLLPTTLPEIEKVFNIEYPLPDMQKGYRMSNSD